MTVELEIINSLSDEFCIQVLKEGAAMTALLTIDFCLLSVTIFSIDVCYCIQYFLSTTVSGNSLSHRSHCFVPGMVVMTMTAVDYDDPSEGTNARLIYSIEKNVIEEETGSPIFEIESETGVIKTAVCCLDRERTPDYSIQVVAMDGGGLKGLHLL
jgi:hypothetical protein